MQIWMHRVTGNQLGLLEEDSSPCCPGEEWLQVGVSIAATKLESGAVTSSCCWGLSQVLLPVDVYQVIPYVVHHVQQAK